MLFKNDEKVITQQVNIHFKDICGEAALLPLTSSKVTP